MKSRIIMCILIFLALFSYSGCVTKPVLFSDLADEYNYASISFQLGNPEVRFVSYNGLTLPVAKSGTHWDPIHFPAGESLRIIVHADYRTTTKTTLSGFGLLGSVVNTVQDIRAVTRNVDADLEFNCPPLEAGKEYLLTFTKEPGMPGRNFLTLTELGTTNLIIQQEFEVNFGGDAVQ